MVAFSSEQPTLTSVSVDSLTLGGSAIVPSELLHCGATTRATPLATRSRNVEDDGHADAEDITKKSAAEGHIKDNATFIYR